MLKKLIIGMIILAVVLSAALVIVNLQIKKAEEQKIANQTEGQQIADNEIDTSGWKIYRNKDYGFEIKYPSDNLIKDWASKTPNWEIFLVVGNNKNIGDGAISIGIEKNTKVFDSEKILWPVSRDDLKITEKQVGADNYLAHEVLVDYRSVDGDVSSIIYYIQHKDKLYQISYNKLYKDGLTINDFKNMLNFFEFID